MSPRLRRRPRAPRARGEVYPPAPPVAGRVLDARLHLLDRQVLDVDGVPVTTVDDVELEAVEATPRGRLGDGFVGRRVVVAALLSGPALVVRIAGGRAPDSRMHRLRWELVAEVEVSVHLGVRGDGLDVTWTERWVRDQVIRRIPGGTHDPG